MTLGHLTRTLLTPALVAGLAATALVAARGRRRGPLASATHAHQPPRRFQPEGIAIRRRPAAYLGSLADGDIYAANLRTGNGHRIHQGDGTPAVGMKLDRKGRLWVAGGADGDAKVVNLRTGRSLATTTSTSSTVPSFVNDVVLRGRVAWFTDSQRAVLYKVSPVRAGRPTPRSARCRSPAPGTRWPNEFNANGISTTPGRPRAARGAVGHRQAVPGQPDAPGAPRVSDWAATC